MRKEEVQEELSKFCVKMMMSGYKEGVRRDVLLSGIKGFERMKRNHEEGRRNLYRKQEEGKEVRWARKISGKESWFKGKSDDVQEEEKVGGNNRKNRQVGGILWRNEGVKGEKGKEQREKVKEDPEVVVFIPHTPNGILKARLQEKDMRMREAMGMKKVKFVERGGRSLQGILCRSNPWREKKCGGKDCLVCQTEAKGKCRV